ncbi:MAG: hypothetical protein M1821_005885 [Bathelium mastoideum]|nr:MAG: hypothetical protein M1821_005885 [Bathelium mastoideum]
MVKSLRRSPPSTNLTQVTGYTVFQASLAHLCLLSVPFDEAVALRFIDYLNTTFQFQSTSAYLKDPPTGYQQPPVDIFQTFQDIKVNVTSGVYKNEYAFELDIQKLIYSIHDAHVDLYAGILSAFTFASPYDIVLVSIDGSTSLSIHLQDDVTSAGQQSWTPSPIVSINGVDVVDFLTDLALINAVGNLEPNADWNQLMGSPALDIQGLSAIFTGGMTVYPGGDDLNFTFANGSDLQTIWIAYYTNPYPTGPLTTGGDFYNYFNDSASSTATQGVISWSNESSGAYPSNPIVVQYDLGITGSGVLTGYYLDDVSTAVLSIPTFLQYGYDVTNFSQTVADFINNASSSKVSKHVIIDLQQNTGGSIALAFNTFMQFFPQFEPFAGSRRRSHMLGNVLGDALTPWWDSLSEDDKLNADVQYASNEWIVTDRLNAETGQNFSSWPQYYGPRQYNGDNFSLIAGPTL